MADPDCKTANDHNLDSFKPLPDGSSARQVCGNEDGEPIPVVDTGDLNPFFKEATGSSSTTEASIVSHTVPAGMIFRANNIYCSTSVEGVCRIKKGGSLIGIIRLGAGLKNGRFEYNPNRELVAAEVLDITFEAANNSGKDVDVFIQGRQFTA